LSHGGCQDLMKRRAGATVTHMSQVAADVVAHGRESGRCQSHRVGHTANIATISFRMGYDLPVIGHRLDMDH
jgi:hypothetical protein